VELDSVQDEKGQKAPDFTQEQLCFTKQEVACMESQTGEKDFNHRASQNDKDVSAPPEMVKNLSFPLDNPDLSCQSRSLIRQLTERSGFLIVAS